MDAAPFDVAVAASADWPANELTRLLLPMGELTEFGIFNCFKLAVEIYQIACSAGNDRGGNKEKIAFNKKL